MIEDELRTLLAARAEGLRDNPVRTAEVRSRITGIRRRRIAGTALGLVLVALAGLAVLRLPGTNESLPPGAPWFDDLGNPRVSGYTAIDTATPAFTGPEERVVLVRPEQSFRYLLVVRCPRPAPLTVRGLGSGATITADCSQPVGDHFEGIVGFDARRADALFEQTQGGVNVRYEPGSAGPWEAALLESNDADRLATKVDIGGRWLAEGTRTRQGTTVPITVPAKKGPDPTTIAMDVSVECVAGVRLELSVPTGSIGTADCDPRRGHGDGATAMMGGRIQVFVSDQQLARLGLKAGDRVPLTIRSVGRDTDQWRVYPIA